MHFFCYFPFWATSVFGSIAVARYLILCIWCVASCCCTAVLLFSLHFCAVIMHDINGHSMGKSVISKNQGCLSEMSQSWKVVSGQHVIDWVVTVKVGDDIAFYGKPISELRSVTCRMGSHR